MTVGADGFGDPVERVAQGSQVHVAIDPAELLAGSTMPAAHQRSAICPSRQRFTLLACVRQIEIIDSKLSCQVDLVKRLQCGLRWRSGRAAGRRSTCAE